MIICISFDVVFIAITHLPILDRECSIAVNMALLPLSVFDCFSFFPCLLLFLDACSASISMDKRSVLNNTFLHFIALLIKLSLQLRSEEHTSELQSQFH